MKFNFSFAWLITSSVDTDDTISKHPVYHISTFYVSLKETRFIYLFICFNVFFIQPPQVAVWYSAGVIITLKT